MFPSGFPEAQGLYDPQLEHEACGVGFVVHVKGHRSHAIVSQGLQVLQNLRHRGAQGADARTGDGAGILLQMPDRFLRRETAALGIALPPAGHYGAGLVFLPHDPGEQRAIRELVACVAAEEGQRVLGWRRVPTDDSRIGASAASVAPAFEQVFIGAGDACRRAGLGLAFERKLYVIRRRVERAIEKSDLAAKRAFYVVSLSSRTLTYKGMLSADQLEHMYPDLLDPELESALALVHQRFSTNTFPSWPLAHPHRFIAHNGEINTLRGNINWMCAREAVCRSTVFGDDLAKLVPIIREGGSDTATFDNVFELLVMSGRSLPHAILMMIPEPWRDHESLSPELKAFYEYHASLMEPWDGPAAVAFTDGTVIGAVLDRNGLRPARYCVTTDDLVVMASEVGVLDIPADRIVQKDRLRPGRVLLVDTARGRIVDDADIKQELARAHPYREWLDANLMRFEDLPAAELPAIPHGEDLLRRLQIFGYTDEELRVVLSPMVSAGEEAIGSMGNDTPLAVLSDHPRLLYDYFKQLFAQVTNPPLDAIREELVTSLESTLGPERNLLEAEPEACRQIKITRPVLDDSELARLRHATHPAFRSVTLPMLYPPQEGSVGLERALNDLRQRATAATRDGCTVLILSDRGVDRRHAPIPSLLATACVHYHLVRAGIRTRCSLIVESGDAREVHHIALLVGYGVGAVNPYVALETAQDLIQRRVITAVDVPTGIENYLKALTKGVLKVMSKMGISTIQGYRGAQIFEAIGLDASVVDRYFTGTASRIGGVGLAVIATDVERRHARAFAARRAGGGLDPGGQYWWRRDGEYHLFNPDTVFKLQHATRSGQYAIFREYSDLVNDQNRRRATLRGLFELKPADTPVPLDEVEPVERIVTRFASGAMSFGSISQEAHETLAIAMNRLGGRSNCGEGGEDAARYVHDANGDWRCSAIKQVASARFGVTSEYLVNATDLQIKIAQGAKPGEGGQLPGHKVYPWIARVRHSTPGVGLISPPPHHDIYSIEDLAQLVYDLKNANPIARIHVKLVAEVGVGTIAAGVAKAHADVVLISGHDGGTGASPLTAIKHSGAPWELGLAETQQVLLLNNLRDRIVVQVDGQLRTGRDVVIAALLGAEEFGFATAPLVVLGCVMMRVCHLNTCPVGIATQDPELRKRFTGRPEFVETFFRFIAEEVRELMAQLGFRAMDDMIGRVDRLDVQRGISHWKAAGVDVSPILHDPPVARTVARHAVRQQEHHLEKGLDEQLIAMCRPALEKGVPVEFAMPIKNSHRTVGTRLGSEVTRRYGGSGLPDDTITLRFTGSAGQSFGAFVPRGITLVLEGDANDYWGKGLSGGKLIVFPPKEARFTPETNVIIGNVALYGVTSGEAYVRGVAGERFAVRNSGVHAVVEGVGDHGCEYMTAGRITVLGATGRNFAAGMSGGLAYVLDVDGQFSRRCNHQMVDVDPLTADDVPYLREIIARHVRYTESAYAARLLADWDMTTAKLVKVTPKDYKRVLEAEERKRHDAGNFARLHTEVAVSG